MTLEEICNELSISTATGRNWVRLGKIIPEYGENKALYFSKEYIENVKKEIQSGSNSALKGRRNKRFVNGKSMYNSYVDDYSPNIGVVQELLQIMDLQKQELNDIQIQILVADCAVKLFAQKIDNTLFQNENILLAFLNREISFGQYDCLILDLIDDVVFVKKWIEEFPNLFELEYKYECKEDILGLLYISCKNLSSRKITGSYYTPTKIVRKMISNVFENGEYEIKILDPCCGTGNFLLQLPDEISFNYVHGNDIDKVSVKIARINMALRFKNADVSMIYSNITNGDFLFGYEKHRFNLILGNPPWGFLFSNVEKEMLRKKYKCAKGKNIESYDVFVEKALSRLTEDGVLSFVLPEAILNVKSHMPIREYIIANSFIQYIEFLGDAFDKVQCPSIILQLKNNTLRKSTVGTIVKDASRQFQILEERDMNPECFNYVCSDEEYNVLKKIKGVENAVFLENNAIFALGIVTGNNKKYITNTKKAGYEMVLKGVDLHKFFFEPSNNYLKYVPEDFQQTAPTKYYRAKEKLLYRFICDQLVFAYDNKQTISLNSCNIVIPSIKNLDMKYILGILNSRVAQYVFKKGFSSVKVLRSHIEKIPIPNIEWSKQQEIIDLVEKLIGRLSERKREELYDVLDDKIRKLYFLDDREYQIIKESV